MPNRGRSNYAQVTDLNVYYEIHGGEEEHMCRNIKPLFNFDPPANDEEVRAAALQFVRKISGFNKPTAPTLMLKPQQRSPSEVRRDDQQHHPKQSLYGHPVGGELAQAHESATEDTGRNQHEPLTESERKHCHGTN